MSTATKRSFTTVNVRQETYDRARVAAAVRGKNMTDAATEALEQWVGDAKELTAKASAILKTKPR